MSLIWPFLKTDATALQAAKLMLSDGCTEIFVVGKDKTPVGVVRQIDIIRAISEGVEPFRAKVEEIMLQPPPSVREEAPVGEVSRIMTDNNVRRLLVKRRDEVIGIIEAGELFTYLSSSTEKIEAFKAISARARMRIAELLSVGPMSVEQLSSELGLKPITVRHHINVLRRSKLVEEIQEEWYGKVGRPLSLFTLTKSVLSRNELNFR